MVMTELTKKDVISMIGLIKANYPYAYKEVAKEDMQMLQAVWLKILGKYPKEVVQTAFYKALETCKMPPTIADLTEIINAYVEAGEETDGELWARLSNAVGRAKRERQKFHYNFVDATGISQGDQARAEYKRLYDDLPDILKDFCGGKDGFSSLTMLDSLEFEKGRFLKTLPSLRKRARVRAETPFEILSLVAMQPKALETTDTQKVQITGN